MREITVKKPLGVVLALLIFGAVLSCVIVFLALKHQILLLLFEFFILPVPVGFLIDYLSWKIIFSNSGITIKTLTKNKKYPFSKIAYVKEYLSTGNNCTIIDMTFLDGSYAVVHERDQHFNDARKILMHRTIYRIDNTGDNFFDWDKASRHIKDKMAERGITQEMVEDWVFSGQAVQLADNRTLYVTKNGAAVVEQGSYYTETPTIVMSAFTNKDYNEHMQMIVRRLFGRGGKNKQNKRDH